MTPLEDIAMAARALLAHRFRSTLTVLSITVGAFAIVLMSSLAESGLATLNFGIEDLGGARLLLVIARPPERAENKRASYQPGISLADGDLVFEKLPHVVGLTLYARLGTVDVTSDGGARARTDLVAADSRFFEVFRMPVEQGRPFSEDENRSHASLCVLGPKLARKLWPGVPIGRMVTLGNLRCRVIGRTVDQERFGVGFGFDWTDLAVVPLETMGELETDVHSRVAAMIKTDAPSHNEVAKRVVNARLLSRHHGIDDFTIIDFSGFMAKFERVFVIMELLVALLAGIALVIGGVGVMNMMLVSVSERVREIGVRKALGARPSDIGRQFLMEASLLSAFGGAAGVGGGLGVAAISSIVLRHLLPTWQPMLSWVAAGAAMLVSLSIGILFGWLPARRASLLDPVTAMRR